MCVFVCVCVFLERGLVVGRDSSRGGGSLGVSERVRGFGFGD